MMAAAEGWYLAMFVWGIVCGWACVTGLKG